AFSEREPERGNVLQVLDRVPKRVDAAGPAAMCLFQSLHETVELTFLFERRINQDKTALFLRRQMRAECEPAIELNDAGLEVTLKAGAERFCVFRVEFDGRQAVLLTQQMASNHGRAWILVQVCAGIDGLNAIEQRGNQISFCL